MALMREIEFEFDQEGAGEFRASGNVVRVIMDHLTKGEQSRAVSLLAASTGEVGDKLIREAQVGASNAFWKKLASLFAEAKDVSRAAHCANVIGDLNMAAGFHEAAYDWENAGASYRRSGNLQKAAEMYERALAFDKAGALYYETGDHQRAAECYAHCGDYYRAGHLYMKIGRYQQAVEVLQRVDRTNKYYTDSSSLLGQFFDKAGNRPAAIQKYAEVVRSARIDDSNVEIHHRLATLLAQSGRQDQAKMVWERVLGHDPHHEGARLGMKLLAAGGDAPVTERAAQPQPRVHAPAAAPAAARTRARARAPTAPPVTSDDRVFSSVPVRSRATGAPLVLPADAASGTEAEGGPEEPMVAVHRDFDVLRALPIFSELSLDELRGFYALCDRVALERGNLLIEQGMPGQALFVLVAGHVKVEVIHRGKPPVEVARLGPGESVGEMSMVDDAPASARVTAIDRVVAFRFPLSRLATHLIADSRAGVKVMKVLGKILSSRLREANRELSR